MTAPVRNCLIAFTLAAPLAAHAAVVSKPPASKLDGSLRALVQPKLGVTLPGARPGGMARIDRSGDVQVYIRFAQWAALPEVALAQLGGRTEIVNAELGIVQARVPVEALEALARQPWVRRVSVPDYARTHRGSVISEGVEIHAGPQLHALGLTGAGARVGVISDGVEGLVTALDSGDIRAGLSTFRGCTTGDTDDGLCAEGVAMLEIVTDIAPDASLAFCGPETSLEMIECYTTLANAFGADIIVDDLAFFGEPYFEDGPVAAAAGAQVAAGRHVVSSAGNSNGKYYEAPYTASTALTSQPGFEDFESEHNFGFAAGGASNPVLSLTIRPDTECVVLLQWADRFGQSANDYDLALFSEGEFVGGSLEPQDGNQDPIEGVLIDTSDETGPIMLEAAILRFSGEDRRLKVFVLGGCTPDQVTPQGQVFGHAAVPGVIAVAAIDAADPGNDELEFFSSTGPVRIEFPSPVLRDKPDISGIDGVSVTGAGGFPNPFFGTSASAPHVAGLLALLQNRFSGDTKQALLDTAIDLGAPGRDNFFGHGRANAFAAAQSLNRAPNALIVSPADDRRIMAGESVSFQGNCVDPEAMPPASFDWDFGDPGVAPSSVQNPGARLFGSAGTFTVTFACTDGFGVASATASRTITVENPPDEGGALGLAAGFLFLLAAVARYAPRTAFHTARRG